MSGDRPGRIASPLREPPRRLRLRFVRDDAKERLEHLTPAEGANGSRLSGFACGRDDLGEGGSASHPLGRHTGQGEAATRCPLAARAAVRTHRRLFCPSGRSHDRSWLSDPGSSAFGLVREDAGRGMCDKYPLRVPMDPGSALRAAGMTSEREAVPHILSAVTPGKAKPRPGAHWLPERR